MKKIISILLLAASVSAFSQTVREDGTIILEVVDVQNLGYVDGVVVELPLDEPGIINLEIVGGQHVVINCERPWYPRWNGYKSLTKYLFDGEVKMRLSLEGDKQQVVRRFEFDSLEECRETVNYLDKYANLSFPVPLELRLGKLPMFNSVRLAQPE